MTTFCCHSLICIKMLGYILYVHVCLKWVPFPSKRGFNGPRFYCSFHILLCANLNFVLLKSCVKTFLLCVCVTTLEDWKIGRKIGSLDGRLEDWTEVAGRRPSSMRDDD